MNCDQHRGERQEHPENECLLDECERVVGDMPTAKPVMDAAKPAASKPSGLPRVRATRPSRRTSGRSARAIRRRRAAQRRGMRPSHWLSRIGALRRGLSIPVCLVPRPCPRSGLRMPSMSLGSKLARPLMRVGSPASVRLRCDRSAPLREEEFLTVAIDPGATILMTINMGIIRGRRGTMSRGRSHRRATVAATIARMASRGGRQSTR